MKRINSITQELEPHEMIYTIMDHTSLRQPSFSILLFGEGLRNILKHMRDGEDLRITLWKDNNTTYSSFGIVDTHYRYK